MAIPCKDCPSGSGAGSDNDAIYNIDFGDNCDNAHHDGCND
jgi:hypothetical protein